MGVGTNTGISAKVAQQISQINKTNPNQTNQQSAGQRNVALNNSPAQVPTAVSAPGAPVAAPVGGTTVPAGGIAARTAPTAPTVPPAAAFPGAMIAANPALAAIAVTSSGKKTSDVSGDKSEGEGSVMGVNEESENQMDALQNTDQEQGAGEINQPGGATAPSA